MRRYVNQHIGRFVGEISARKMIKIYDTRNNLALWIEVSNH